jgi:hypothetical protein
MPASRASASAWSRGKWPSNSVGRHCQEWVPDFGQHARQTSGASVRSPLTDRTLKTTAISRPHDGHFGLTLTAGERSGRSESGRSAKSETAADAREREVVMVRLSTGASGMGRKKAGVEAHPSGVNRHAGLLVAGPPGRPECPALSAPTLSGGHLTAIPGRHNRISEIGRAGASLFPVESSTVRRL